MSHPSQADRNADSRARSCAISRGKCADPRRRKRLESVPEKWLRWYLAAAYPRQFDRPHREIIKGTIKASDTAGRFAVAGERGIGKSTLLWGLVLYLKLSGKQAFPVCLPWAAPGMKRALSFWKNALCHNERIAADYPEFCRPFVEARGISQRLNSLAWDDTGEPCGAALQIGDGMIVLPDALGCIGGSSINGNPRGLNLPQTGGGVLRPTIALVDDPQDRKTAKSAALSVEAVQKIDGDVGGLGEAGKEFPILISGNCIKPDDVMAHYLKCDGWKSLKVPCVESWPDGWEKPAGQCRVAWEEWRGLFASDEKAALAYYREHRAVMTSGMVITSPHSYAKSKAIPDGCYGAMRQYFKLGHEAFMAEKQQEPTEEGAGDLPYRLDAALICSRVAEREAFVVPEWVATKIASTDVNPSYALTSAMVGFGRDQTAAVCWYGLYTGDPLPIKNEMPAQERARRVYEAVLACGRQLASLACRPDLWLVDASGEYFDAILRACGEAGRVCGLNALACTGASGKNYRPFGKNVFGPPREHCHKRTDTADGRRRVWLSWHADYWREVEQRAWLGSVGAPGSVSLFRGQHASFAEQICRERLMGKADVGGAMMWNWHTAPGPHDYGDVMAQAYAGAAWGGIGTGGDAPRPSSKANVVIYRPSGRR